MSEIVVWKAISGSGETCAFGVESLARIWAKNGGSVERLEFWTPAKRPAATDKAMGGMGVELNHLLERWARWIVDNKPKYGGDHACAECYPHSKVLKEGFVCVYHEAKKFRDRSNACRNRRRTE